MKKEQKIYKVAAAQNRGLQLAEYESSTYVHYVPHGVTLNDVINPAAWCNVARELKPYDTIDVRWEDMTERAILHVLDVSMTSAKVFVAQHFQYTEDDKELSKDGDDLYEVKWRGQAKWSIVRKSDGEVMQDRLQSQEDAIRHKAELIKNGL